MLTIAQLDFGFNDAENYRRKETKELFNKIFIRTDALDRLCETNIFFLIGEKGTGKTAHAVYLANTIYHETAASVSYIRETEYEKFLLLKKAKQLNLTDYTVIWKIIIYLLIAQKVQGAERNASVLPNFIRFRDLRSAIDEYYMHTTPSEIAQALDFVENSRNSAELIHKHARQGNPTTEPLTFSDNRFAANLNYLQRKFEQALSSIKLDKNYVLFVDGIDIRPSGVPYEDYVECIKGLANAIWSINNDFFSNIRDSKGRMRAVLLARPDIFLSLGLQNTNNKLRDNAVLLDWRTSYSEYRTSNLFKLADRLFGAQQKIDLPVGAAWDHYFPYEVVNLQTQKKNDSPFIRVLRLSMWRPRDLVSMFAILQENHNSQENRREDVFTERDIISPVFQRQYSDYLLGEVKDQLAFYYSLADYELFLKFFTFLGGKKLFDYEQFVEAYDELIAFTKANGRKIPQFFEAPDVFLQFIFELNVICYEEQTGDEYIKRWSFRERTPANMSPKVKSHERYFIHDGLSKALNVGKPVVSRGRGK